MLAAYWPLSSAYFFYFAVLGATHPYWGLYLQSLGFSAEQIGTLMAIFIATKLIAPNIWSYFADKSGQHVQVMRLGALLTPLFFSAVYLQQGFWSMALVMVLYSFFWNAILPQYEVITLRMIRGQEERYSQIRLWGSVGFIAAVSGLGGLLDWVEVRWLPAGILCIMLAMAAVSWWIPRMPRKGCPEETSSQQASSGQAESEWGVLNQLRRPAVLTFLLAVILMQASHGPYYTFFSIFMEDIGYSRSLIGLLWALGVMAEVVLFAVMHLLLRLYRARHLLLLSLVLTAVRWSVIAYFADFLPALLLSQLLHAASFGLFHAACIALVQMFFTGHAAAQGQALYSSLGFGAGGALGAWGSGFFWVQLGPQGSYLLAAILAALGAAILAVSLKKCRNDWAAD